MEDRKNTLIIDQLPKRFNEGLFWGNGVIGALCYVVGNSLRFSIDHVKLWETRDSSAVTPAGTFQDFIKNPELFHNGTYHKNTSPEDLQIWRTRLPGLSLDIRLEEEITGFLGELNLDNATANIKLTLKNQKQVNCLVVLDSNVNVLRVQLDREQARVEIKGWETKNESLKVLKDWNYQAYREVKTQEINHVLQLYSESGIAVISMTRVENTIYLAMNADLLENSEKEKIDAKIDAATDEMVQVNSKLLRKYRDNEVQYQSEHDRSWRQYWSQCQMEVPNERLQQAFHLEMYKIFANERPGSWPVTLQGIWNNDERMPAWYGDWHNDLNIQACYWPVYKTNHIELAQAYVDFYTQAMPRLTERAYQLFGIKEAIHCPVMQGPGGSGVGGEWCFWNTLLGPELFVATDFCWYYDYSRDVKRLRSSVFPFVDRVINLYLGIAYHGDDGFDHIPFSNAPELFKDGRMLIKDDSTVVISALHYILEKMAHYADILGLDPEKYISFNDRLAPLKTTDNGYPVFPDEKLFESHRHFTQMFPVFPLGTDCHSETAVKTLNTITNQGFMGYAAWSFPYLSIFASRCGRGNMARTMLEIYCMAFRSRNTFVVNGDPNWNGILAISDTNAGESSDAFTVEAGFMVVAAMSEMFVHRSKDSVWIGYGLPDEWKQCKAVDLTIEGSHRISVEVEDYQVQKVTVTGNCDEILSFVIKNPAAGLMAEGNYIEAETELRISLSKGKVVCFE